MLTSLITARGCLECWFSGMWNYKSGISDRSNPFPLWFPSHPTPCPSRPGHAGSWRAMDLGLRPVQADTCYGPVGQTQPEGSSPGHIRGSS